LKDFLGPLRYAVVLGFAFAVCLTDEAFWSDWWHQNHWYLNVAEICFVLYLCMIPATVAWVMDEDRKEEMERERQLDAWLSGHAPEPEWLTRLAGPQKPS
jgi:hypothetical protein